MNTKNVNKLVVIPLVFILVLTLSITYALFTKSVNTNGRNITLSSTNKYIGIYGTNKDNIELNKEYTFTIENRGSSNAGYEVYIESETNIDLSEITYTVGGDFSKTGTLSDTSIIYSALASEDTKTITLRLTSASTENYVGKLKIRYKEYVVNYNYNGTDGTNGSVQTFTTPTSGNYKLEVWGAQGGYSYEEGELTRGGYGAYSVGVAELNKNTNLYTYVGGAGKYCRVYGSTTSGTKTCGDDGGYNGGGSTRQYTENTFYGSGGGATHIAINNNRGVLANYTGNQGEVLIVAGGGGGASRYYPGGNIVYDSKGGDAGGVNGSAGVYSKLDRNVSCTGGTQITAGTGSDTSGEGLGHGGNMTKYVGPGGGSGWYGGGTSEVISCGGSSYIGNQLLKSTSTLEKHMTCYNCTPSNEEISKTNTVNIADSNPTPDRAKIGNGYAKITYIEN